jgi:uncharacterized protein (TIGR02118 family)
MSTKPGAIVTALYKRTPDLKFDYDYYQTKHVPLAGKFWAPRGLTEAYSTTPTEDSEFVLSLTMFWTSLDAWKEANQVADEMEEIFADVPNFTNGKPMFVVGKVLS